ncbi:MAG: hypothetical protein KA174_05900 [Chitinophagales bacterium]|nr:hypothetical protein [Chitinophagales bacterium]
MKHLSLENSDAIVLLSILYASEFGIKKVNIQNLIANFDYIEHAIVNYEELSGALCRLNENLYIIEVEKLKFLPTDIILDNFNKFKIQNRNINIRKTLEFIRELINAKEWDSNFDYIKANEKYYYKGLDNEKYQLACNNYIGK